MLYLAYVDEGSSRSIDSAVEEKCKKIAEQTRLKPSYGKSRNLASALDADQIKVHVHAH